MSSPGRFLWGPAPAVQAGVGGCRGISALGETLGWAGLDQGLRTLYPSLPYRPLAGSGINNLMRRPGGVKGD